MVLSVWSMAALAAMVAGLAYSAARRSYVSLQVALVTILIFALEVVSSREGPLPGASPILLELGFAYRFPPQLRPQPEWVWGPAGVITSVYVHANTLHLLYNVLALIIFGLLLEDRIGPLRFAIAYYVTGVMGGVGFLMANYDQTFLLVGASGAVSGVFGVFARLYPHQRLSLWFFFPLPPLPVYVLFIGNLVVQFFLAIAGSFTPFGAGVAYVAHIVAAAGGWAIGPLFAPDRHRPTEPAKRQPFPPELAGLATTQELRDIMAHVERETVAEVREAWLERFRERSRCPRCGGVLTWSRGNAVSDCGWSLKGR